jgi:hypothetical protein
MNPQENRGDPLTFVLGTEECHKNLVKLCLTRCGEFV